MLLHLHISAHLDLPLHHGHLLLIDIKDITMATGQNLMMVHTYFIYCQLSQYLGASTSCNPHSLSRLVLLYLLTFAFSRVFKLLCKEKKSEHKTLLLHTEIRWLSNGKVFVRVFELCSENNSFFIDRPYYLSHCLVNTSWLEKLA